MSDHERTNPSSSIGADAIAHTFSTRECDQFDAVAPSSSTLFQLLGRAYTLPLLYALVRTNRPWRFNELEAELEINQTTLSKRLGELVDAELVVRRSFDEIPPRVEYEATGRANALKPAFNYIGAWAEGIDPREIHR